jgi:hypothetical protein
MGCSEAILLIDFTWHSLPSEIESNQPTPLAQGSGVLQNGDHIRCVPRRAAGGPASSFQIRPEADDRGNHHLPHGGAGFMADIELERRKSEGQSI